MSHFSVIVIGDDVEAQLQPYHEFECTGTDDQFVQDVDKTAEVQARIDDGESLEEALGWFGLESKVVASEAEIDKAGAHLYGYAIVTDGKLVKAVGRTNPNKKWDWWVVGGRWSGFLKLKAGAIGELGRKGLMGSCADDGPGRADVARKGDVDFAGMRDAAGEKAAAEWDRAASIIAGRTWRTWEQCREEDHKGSIDAARSAYHGQQVIADLKKGLDAHPFHKLDPYLQPREQFVQAARDRACVPYALVRGGEWIAKGDMGWFGFSDDKVAAADWNREVNSLLDALPDDTVLTVVDCHI